ncbi:MULTISPECIES: adenosylcobinamide-GDP ribazoletransferase [Paracoccus]|uniref:adenosylcobinamide-GDP ribazoletransferase n=1 Tax=Paracoccus TaxID=265 RepID=UPI001FB855F3|nr:MULTISPECIES: adenosylcobinamide-GDP ribazoletransferase [Paracoccus]MCJ1900371.1 adenosylcobinamide-GDP ribazoletransferase [Paracoccus versutus]MDF3905510.1 adenosylcobinamide-GDP ribazoletransferase [Paracoccus sp. AS002]
MARLLAQAALALVWLTRLPVGRLLPASPPTLAQAAWAFPLVGLAVGFIGAAVLGLAALAGLPGMVAALLAVGAMILATGALHEDGLADCADGSGGATRERRLEIMRDSRIGSYGVLALVLVTGLRVAAIAALVAQPWLAAEAVAGLAAASRAGMALGLGLMPPARHDGLGHAAGRPTRGAMLAALALGFAALMLPALDLPHPAAGWLVLAAAVAAAQLWLARRALRALGGQTGDVLGAMQQAGETAGLVALAALA